MIEVHVVAAHHRKNEDVEDLVKEEVMSMKDMNVNVIVEDMKRRRNVREVVREIEVTAKEISEIDQDHATENATKRRKKESQNFLKLKSKRNQLMVSTK